MHGIVYNRSKELSYKIIGCMIDVCKFCYENSFF